MFRGLELLTSVEITQHKQLRIRSETSMMNQTVRMVKTPEPYPLEKALFMGERDKELLAKTNWMTLTMLGCQTAVLLSPLMQSQLRSPLSPQPPQP